MRHLIFVAVAAAAALSACAEPSPPAPTTPQGIVSYKLRDHTGATEDHSASRTERQTIYYTKDQLHPDGLSDPVLDRAAAIVFSVTPFGIGADPQTIPKNY